MTDINRYIYTCALLCGSLTAAADVPAEWIDLGEGKLTDDIISLYENYDAPTYPVKIQKDAQGKGWYRISNPFENNPELDAWSGCELIHGDHYIVIDATDPDNVHIPMCELGVEAYGDPLSLVSISLYPDPSDLYYDPDEAAAMAGRLDGNIITFECEESLVLVSEFGAECTNISGMFKVVLPDGGDTPDPGSDPEPLTPPFNETFATGSFTESFTVIDANDDGVTWQPYLGSAQVSYNSDLAMDDWLVTPPLALEEGKKYVVSVDVLTGNASDKETLEVMFGTSPAVNAMTGTIIGRMDIAHTSYVTYTGVLAPDATGTYHIGIHGCSAADKYSISLKNLSVAAGVSPVTPAAPSGLTVITRTNGELKADITLKAPATDLEGNPLESIDFVKLMREGLTIHTFEAPDPGAELTWTDEVDECSRFSYSATATAEGMEGPATETSAFVGVLEPAAPTGVEIADAEEAGTVTLTWQPSDTDIRGNALDPRYVTYRIYEGGAGSPLFSGLAGTMHTFKAVDDTGTQQFVRYEVVAETRGGISDFSSSMHHPVGNAYELPYNESFANGEPKYIMANNTSNTADWDTYTDDPEITAQDGDNGFAGSKASYFEDTALWHTGKISLAGAVKPELSFHIYALVDGYDGDTSRIKASIVCDGQTKTLKTVVVSRMGDEDGWYRITCPITEYKDKTVRLGFTATHDTMRYIFIDNILIHDAYSSAAMTDAPDTTEKVEYYNLQGIKTESPSGGIFIRRQGDSFTKIIVR